LTGKTKIIIRLSVAPLSREEREGEDIKQTKHKFAAGTNTYLEDKINDLTVQETPESISID